MPLHVYQSSRYVGKGYRGTKGSDVCSDVCCRLLCLVLGLILAPFLYGAEQVRMQMLTSRESVINATRAVSNDTIDPDLVGHLVHFYTTEVTPTDTIVDNDFAIQFPEMARVKRTVEHCQWVEVVVETTYKDSDGYEHTTSTYTYHKQWVSNPIPSLLFHHMSYYNPLRQPYHDQAVSVQGLHLGPYIADQKLIENNLKLDVRLNHTHFESTHGATPSAAETLHGFRYIGDGYFYSAYKPSEMEWFLHLTSQVVEGTVLGHQIANLFGSCSAGDIRVSYRGANPQAVSVLSKLASKEGQLTHYQAADVSASGGKYEVGILHSGYIEPAEMIDISISEQFWGSVIWLRLGLFALLLFVFGFRFVGVPLFAVGILGQLNWGVGPNVHSGMIALAVIQLLSEFFG